MRNRLPLVSTFSLKNVCGSVLSVHKPGHTASRKHSFSSVLQRNRSAVFKKNRTRRLFLYELSRSGNKSIHTTTHCELLSQSNYNLQQRQRHPDWLNTHTIIRPCCDDSRGLHVYWSARAPAIVCTHCFRKTLLHYLPPTNKHHLLIHT